MTEAISGAVTGSAGRAAQALRNTKIASSSLSKTSKSMSFMVELKTEK